MGQGMTDYSESEPLRTGYQLSSDGNEQVLNLSFTARSEQNLPDRFKDGQPLIAILLCTYNGANYLVDQLDSFIRQTHKNWVVYASDDGSTDGTVEILQSYQLYLGTRLIILNGPRQGFAKNFISLIKNKEIEADYFAFSDQDDIWMPEKLTRSLAALPSGNTGVAALYCSRTQLVDEAGKTFGFSPLFTNPPSFRNALVQSLAGANTMLINQRTRELLARTAPDAQIVAHDWLTYLLVSSFQGVIVYDPEPTLLYRQHGGNLIGSNIGLKCGLSRLGGLLHGRFSKWNDMNLNILLQYKGNMDQKNRRILEQFELARKSPLFKRLRLLAATGVYRQTLAGNLGLIVAAILNKL